MRFVLAVALVDLLAACSSTPASSVLADGGGDLALLDDAGSADEGLLAARPYTLHVPPGLDPTVAAPLVVMLHGYASDGANHERTFFKLLPVSDAHGFLYAYGDGTLDALNMRFWNATDGCCNLFKVPVDDVAYVNAILDDVEAHHRVDLRRVYVVGHSNGGFMAHRLACDLSSRVAAIVSVAGAQWGDVQKCKSTTPVSVLQIHGTADTVIRYDGGYADGYMGFAMHPSAHETVADWASLDGCTGTLAPYGSIDLVTTLPGAETRQERYDGCPAGVTVELWTIAGGSHEPAWTDTFGETLYQFLAGHAKP